MRFPHIGLPLLRDARWVGLPTIGFMQTESTSAGPQLDRIEAILRDSLPEAEASALVDRIRTELVDPMADWEELAAENARLQHELERQAETDTLTGVRNRRRFFADLRRELDLARRHEEALALLVVDLDGLARINDSHGFEAGDGVLVSLAEMLLRTVRVTDMVARIAGDDFAIILPRTDLNGAERAAERIADATEVPVLIGAAQLSSDVTSGAQLLELAYSTLVDRRGATRRRD
jgi:diguanylate cyclase (GGDEF)-like protein